LISKRIVRRRFFQMTIILPLFLSIAVSAAAPEGEWLIVCRRTDPPKDIHSPLVARATNELLAINLDTRAQRVLFSDASLPWALISHRAMSSSMESMVASNGHSVFAAAAERAIVRTMPGPYSEPGGAIVELATDGTNAIRRVANIEGNTSPDAVFVSPRGTKVGYYLYNGDNQIAVIHDVRSGALLRRIQFKKALPPGNVRDIGWMNDDTTLYIVLRSRLSDMYHQNLAQLGSVDGLYTLANDSSTAIRVYSGSVGWAAPAPNGDVLIKNSENLFYLHDGRPGERIGGAPPYYRSPVLSVSGKWFASVEETHEWDVFTKWYHVWVKDLSTCEQTYVFTDFTFMDSFSPSARVTVYAVGSWSP